MNAVDIGEGVLTTEGAVFMIRNELREVDCVVEGCNCPAMHQVMTGRKFISFETGPHRFTAELVPGSDKWEAS